MKKRAYETYYRDKFGELKVQLVDAETGELVTNPKDYTVVDSTDVQGQEVTGNPAVEDTTKPATTSSGKMTPIPIRRFAEGGDRDKRGGKGKVNGPDNNFGFINKPKWAKYASFIPGPIGKVAAIANLGINAANVKSINDTRKHLGLEPLSRTDIIKGVLRGVDEGSVGDVKIGDTSYGVSLRDPVIDNRSQLTVNEVHRRNDANKKLSAMEKAQQAVHDGLVARGFQAKSKIHPEIDPAGPTTVQKGTKTSEPMADMSVVNENRGMASLVGKYGKHRPNAPSTEISDKVRQAAAMVYGPDAKVVAVSGTEGNLPQYGSNRHKTTKAMDFHVEVNGVKQTDPAKAKDFAETASSLGVMGTGYGNEYMGPGTFHMDTVDPSTYTGNQDRAWGSLGNAWQRSLLSAEKLGATSAERAVPHNIPMTRDMIDSVPSSTSPAVAQDATRPSTLTDRHSLMTDAEAESYTREAALARGMDPETAAAVAKSEGLGHSYQSTLAPGGVREESYGDFQLNMGPGSLGATFQSKTTLDPRDPANRRDMIDYALDHVVENGWGDFHGAKRVGITDWQGLDNAHPLASVPDLGPDASAFAKYSAGYFSALQAQPDPQAQANKARQDAANRPQIAKMDNPMSPNTGVNPANSGMSSSANFGSAQASAGAMARGNGSISPSYTPNAQSSTRGSSFGGAGTGAYGSGSFGRGYGAGVGSVGKGNAGSSFSAGPSGFSSGSKSGSSTSFSSGGYASKSTSDKDKDRSMDGRSQGPSGGGYGGWGGPR